MTVNQSVNAPKQKRNVEIYWILIALFLAIMGGLYVYHLITGQTPNRVAFALGGGFEVYWYGICIVGGIALGAYVVSRLAEERGTAVFTKEVRYNIRKQPLSVLDLPEELAQTLAKHKITTMGDLLLVWGYNPKNTGLNKEGIQVVQAKLYDQRKSRRSVDTGCPLAHLEPGSRLERLDLGAHLCRDWGTSLPRANPFPQYGRFWH